MSAKKQDNNQRYRSIAVAALVILGVVLTFNYFNRGSSNSNNMVASIDHEEASLSGAVKVLSTANFDDVIAKGVVLVDFWATWCPPCRIQGPIIEELAGEIGGLAVISKLDVDHHGAVAARFEVRSIPTLIIFKDGEPVRRFVGVQQKEILASAIKDHL